MPNKPIGTTEALTEVTKLNQPEDKCFICGKDNTDDTVWHSPTVNGKRQTAIRVRIHRKCLGTVIK